MFRHVELDRLKLLYQKGLVQRFNADKSSSVFDCTAYIQAKQAHTLFPNEATQHAELLGELTHTNLWGPAHTESIRWV